jgi:hypothetical protein
MNSARNAESKFSFSLANSPGSRSSENPTAPVAPPLSDSRKPPCTRGKKRKSSAINGMPCSAINPMRRNATRQRI